MYNKKKSRVLRSTLLELDDLCYHGCREQNYSEQASNQNGENHALQPDN